MPDVDDVNAGLAGRLDRLGRAAGGALGVRERQRPAGEVLVLDVDHDQSVGHRAKPTPDLKP